MHAISPGVCLLPAILGGNDRCILSAASGYDVIRVLIVRTRSSTCLVEQITQYLVLRKGIPVDKQRCQSMHKPMIRVTSYYAARYNKQVDDMTFRPMARNLSQPYLWQTPQAWGGVYCKSLPVGALQFALCSLTTSCPQMAPRGVHSLRGTTRTGTIKWIRCVPPCSRLSTGL